VTRSVLNFDKTGSSGKLAFGSNTFVLLVKVIMEIRELEIQENGGGADGVKRDGEGERPIRRADKSCLKQTIQYFQLFWL
jgi:hypothetical protein